MPVVREMIRHQAAIAGRVKDGQTGQAIGGALVKITNGPDAFINQFITWAKLAPLTQAAPDSVVAARATLDNAAANGAAKLAAAQTVLDYLQPVLGLARPDIVRSRPDGHYHYLDLPDGQYTLGVTLPGAGTRYATAAAQASVVRAPNGRLTLALVDVALTSTTVQGTITNGNAAPVRMATVRIKGSGEQTFSDAQGKYTLSGLEVGSRTLIVSARGYETVTQTVTFDQPGAVQTVNVTLRPVTP